MAKSGFLRVFVPQCVRFEGVVYPTSRLLECRVSERGSHHVAVGASPNYVRDDDRKAIAEISKIMEKLRRRSVGDTCIDSQ